MGVSVGLGILGAFFFWSEVGIGGSKSFLAVVRFLGRSRGGAKSRKGWVMLGHSASGTGLEESNTVASSHLTKLGIW